MVAPKHPSDSADLSRPRTINLSSRHGFRLVDRPVPDIDRDPLFMEIFARSRHYTMTSKERLYALYQSVRYVIESDIPGDYVECGVWKGGSSILAALTFERVLGQCPRKLYLYDTFEGMTPPQDVDIDLRGIKAQEYMDRFSDAGKLMHYAESEVLANFAAAGVKSAELVIVKGNVEQTIPGRQPETICICRLDTDWYQSTAHELRYLYPNVSEGGVLILDDYGYWQGARKAVDEYFRQSPVFLHRLDSESRLIIKSRRRPAA